MSCFFCQAACGVRFSPSQASAIGFPISNCADSMVPIDTFSVHHWAQHYLELFALTKPTLNKKTTGKRPQ